MCDSQAGSQAGFNSKHTHLCARLLDGNYTQASQPASQPARQTSRQAQRPGRNSVCGCSSCCQVSVSNSARHSSVRGPFSSPSLIAILLDQSPPSRDSRRRSSSLSARCSTIRCWPQTPVVCQPQHTALVAQLEATCISRPAATTQPVGTQTWFAFALLVIASALLARPPHTCLLSSTFARLKSDCLDHRT